MPGLFGSQNDNRFHNVTVNFPQPQQGPSQQSTSLSQPSQQSLIQSQFNQTNEREPSWFNNPKKRIVPQRIIKRSSKQVTSDSVPAVSQTPTNLNVATGFESISFGSKKVNVFPNGNVSTETDILNNRILIDSNEAPPTKSLYDWQREDEFGSTISISQNNITTKQVTSSKVDNKIKSRNAFDRDNQEQSCIKENAQQKISETVQNDESAVLVFGYPEAISNQVIIHFSKFGNILEDFEVLRGVSGMNTASIKLCDNQNNEMPRKYPIFTGDGWSKLTYDSPSGAMRALQENGGVYGGCLIGCVPYTKSAVEQLASCKIDKKDDIGCINLNISTSSNFEYIKEISDSEDQSVSQKSKDHLKLIYSNRRLHIKDGASLFVHNSGVSPSSHNFLKSLEDKMREQEQDNQSNTGLLNKINNWLFGWNNL